MIICGTHDDLDTSPQVPMIVGAPLPKRPKQESLTSALVEYTSESFHIFLLATYI